MFNLSTNTIPIKHQLLKIIFTLFSNTPCLQYSGPNHHLIDWALQQASIPISLTSLALLSSGYCSPSGYILTESNNSLNLFKSYNYNVQKDLRMLIITQNLIQNCNNYQTFDIDKGLDTYLLYLPSIPDRILLFSVRDCVQLDISNPNWIKPKWLPPLNKTITISALHFPPILECHQDELLNSLESKIINFITKGLPTKVNCYPEMRWDLIGDDLIQNRSDIGGGGNWEYDIYRSTNIINSYYQQTCINFLVPKPHKLPVTFKVFQALHPKTWGLILLLIVLTTGLVSSIFTNSSISEIFFALLSLLCLNTNDFLKKKNKMNLRLILTSWSVNAILITTVYSAGFTILLASPKYSSPIQTIEDMNDAEVVCMKVGPWAFDILNGSGHNHENAIASRMTEDRDNPRLNCHVVDYLPYGYIKPEAQLSREEESRLMILADCLLQVKTTILVNAYSPLKKVIDEKLLQLMGHGLIDRWQKEILYRPELRAKMSQFASIYPFGKFPEKVPFTIEELQGGFYLLLVGYILSGFVFILELYI